MRLKLPFDAVSYFGRERQKYNEAMGQFGMPSPQEQAMMKEQVKAVEQSQFDRRATRDMILGQLGFKVGEGEGGKKTLVPLTNEERIQMMSQADRSRSEAQQSYSGRAKAALTGTTKLPSFLKRDVDFQKVKEEAMLEEMLGPEALQSTAGQQAIEAMKKKESDMRQAIQEQDIGLAPEASQRLGGQMEAKRMGLIGAYEALPNQGAGLIQGRGSLLQQMQQGRLDALNKRLAELEDKRMRINQIFTLGGTIGGAAASLSASKKTPTTTPKTSGYDPNYQYQSLDEPNMSLYGWRG